MQTLPQLKLPPYIPFYSDGWQMIEITDSDKCDYICWSAQAFTAEYGEDGWVKACDQYLLKTPDYEECNQRVKCSDCWLWGYC